MNFFGDTYDEPKPLIIIDTPGLDDVTTEKTKQRRLDFQAKLVAMQRIDLVLMLLGKQALIGGSTFPDTAFQMIDDIITVFDGNTPLYDHFAIGFSCCDEFERNWKIDFDKKSKQWQDRLQSELIFRKHGVYEIENDKLTMNEIPMYKLSNIQHYRRFNKKGVKRWSQYKEFERLCQLCVESQENPLYSTDYILMQKMRTAIERIQNVKQTILD